MDTHPTVRAKFDISEYAALKLVSTKRSGALRWLCAGAGHIHRGVVSLMWDIISMYPVCRIDTDLQLHKTRLPALVGPLVGTLYE